MAKTAPRSRQAAKSLRLLRLERELTQQRLGDEAGLTQTRYWQIEHGQGAPVRRAERLSIARVLNVVAEDIAWPSRTLTQEQLIRMEAREERQRRLAVELLGGRP